MSLIDFRQIADASKLADFRELNNIGEDEKIPRELLIAYFNQTGKDIEYQTEDYEE